MVVGQVVECCFHGRNFYLSVDAVDFVHGQIHNTHVLKSIKIGITQQINSQMSIV